MKILIHLCCANCAIHPVKVLRESGFDVTGYFYNHNIHPYQEYRRRLQTVQEYAATVDLPVIYQDSYDLEDFLSEVAQQPSIRCNYCYQSRLQQVAAYASASDFEAFTSSLLYSRYQNHELIRETGMGLGQRHGIQFYYDDFRKGWLDGIEASKAMGLYRQQYCGCIYSEKERYHPQRKN